MISSSNTRRVLPLASMAENARLMPFAAVLEAGHPVEIAGMWRLKAGVEIGEAGMHALEVEISRQLAVDPNAAAVFRLVEIPVRARIQAAVQNAIKRAWPSALVRRREQADKAPWWQRQGANAIGSRKRKLVGGEKAIDPRHVTPVAIARRGVVIVDGRMAH